MTAEGSTGAPLPPEVQRILDMTYTDEGCRIWWKARNRNLDRRRPCDVWQTDRLAVLIEARRIEG